MSIRLYHRGARFVLPLARRDDDVSERRWLALHLRRHDWAAIFAVALRTLDLAGAPGVELEWTAHRCWTTIRLRLSEGSLRKRQLIASALLKAARYQLL